jgi:hypothetical protein
VPSRLLRRKSSEQVSSLIGRAGSPAARTRGGSSPLTTEPADTTVWSPMVLPGSTVTFRPIHTFRPMVTGANLIGWTSSTG